MNTDTMVEKLEKVLTIADCDRCFASKAQGTIIDTIRPETGLSWYSGKSLAQCRQEYPDAEEMSIEDFWEWKAKQQRTPIEWVPTTEDRFTEMLECLPPALGLRGGFLVGEPFDHDAGNGQPRFEGYRQRDELYEMSNRPMTRAEFRYEIRHWRYVIEDARRG